MSSSHENSTSISDLSVPFSDIPRQKSPLPLRLLKEIEEETWLSGSELKTDNSSSDDEKNMCGKKTGAVTKTKKSKIRSKKRNKVKISEEKITVQTSTCIENIEKTEEPGADQNTNQLNSLQIEEPEDYQWRPKRGSISLPGLNLELEQVEIK